MARVPRWLPGRLPSAPLCCLRAGAVAVCAPGTGAAAALPAEGGRSRGYGRARGPAALRLLSGGCSGVPGSGLLARCLSCSQRVSPAVSTCHHP